VTKIKRTTTLLALLGACLAAAGCGSDDEGQPLPAESAALLQEQLENIQARIDNGSVGACDDILSGPRGPNVDAVEQAISDLPGDVSKDVRSGLEDGFNRLFQLVEERCTELREQAEGQQEPETETEVVPPPETDTETETEPPPETDTETDTETVPPTDTGEQPTTTTEEPSEEQPPSDGEGDGGGTSGGTGSGAGGTGGVIAPQGDEG
jgi:hypothetical protein